MRSTYTFLMLFFPALALINSWWFGRELKGFVDATPAIQSSADLERMKAVVKRQMIAALGQILLLTAGPGIYAVGLYRHVLAPADVVYIIVPSALVLAAGVALKRVEVAARSLPAADDELRRQRDAIVGTWLHKPFPDW
jgi:hypothetical protein